MHSAEGLVGGGPEVCSGQGAGGVLAPCPRVDRLGCGMQINGLAVDIREALGI
jgi:hypothetical protein